MGLKRFPLTYAGMQGSQLVAALINCIFYGVALVVTGQYARRHARKDPLFVKVMIGMMIILATLQNIFINHQLYLDVITNHTETRGLEAPIHFSLGAKFICVYLITFIAQFFFVTRIWTLTKNLARTARFTLIPIIGCALLQVGSGSAIVHYESTSATIAELATHAKWNRTLTAIQGASTAACDIAITATLCYLYQAHRSVSSKVNSAIDRLIIYAVNRAAATSLSATLAVFFYFFINGTYYFVIPTYMTGQLYVISAVSVLTSHESLRGVNDPIANDDSERGSVTKFDSASGSEKHV
ncbi:hypothetical protein FA13DRAFT_1816386 [Coprinellus micaceus]|uniref:DUF6534 domain-containing protein n=1 Tax=Coprinellus micaceus TaxID=71717 RepID=A0A4Y7T020_COPMI|nr:hypothetical protein FA13DRAFT_1816386 [Coprinellus micaceus]